MEYKYRYKFVLSLVLVLSTSTIPGRDLSTVGYDVRQKILFFHHIINHQNKKEDGHQFEDRQPSF
jgi:hypothetical protein